MSKYHAKYLLLRQIGQLNVLVYEGRNIFFASTARPQPLTVGWLCQMLGEALFLHADYFAPALASVDLFSHFDGDLESAIT